MTHVSEEFFSIYGCEATTCPRSNIAGPVHAVTFTHDTQDIQTLNLCADCVELYAPDAIAN